MTEYETRPMTDKEAERFSHMLALEELMDQKIRMARAHSLLRTAIWALQQAQFDLALNKETAEYRLQVIELKDNLSTILAAIDKEQADIRTRFQRIVKEEMEE